MSGISWILAHTEQYPTYHLTFSGDAPSIWWLLGPVVALLALGLILEIYTGSRDERDSD